jgi:hypothetical protein
MMEGRKEGKKEWQKNNLRPLKRLTFTKSRYFIGEKT